VPGRPPAPEDPITGLVAEQAELGIDAWTATPRWDGLQMDVDFALWALRGAGPLEQEVQPPDPGPDVSAETPPAGIEPPVTGDVSAETPSAGGGGATGGTDDDGSSTVWRHASAETPPEEPG
jgi:hypothetical protein